MVAHLDYLPGMFRFVKNAFRGEKCSTISTITGVRGCVLARVQGVQDIVEVGNGHWFGGFEKDISPPSPRTADSELL